MSPHSADTPPHRFRDRRGAGRLLAEKLRSYADRDDVIVLGLPPGGVPVAYEVAEALRAPLDVFTVRKLAAPGHDDAAIGAVATGGTRIVDRDAVEELLIPEDWLDAIDARESRALARREQAYRGDRPPPTVTRQTVLLVDDGLATTSTLRAAIRAIRKQRPAKLVVAAPDTDPELRDLAGEAVDLSAGTKSWNDGVPSDDEIRALLDLARTPAPSRGPAAVGELRGTASDYDAIVDRAKTARRVLLGEASHGTDDFYRERAEITKRLIAEHGFTVVAVEADWPEALRVNRFVRGLGDDATPEEALGDFRRFPSWMWRNTAVADFVGWLREWNDAVPSQSRKVGFYGLDLHSLFTSIDAVIAFLDDVDDEAADRARERYSSFSAFGDDPQVYAYEAGFGDAEPGEPRAAAQLAELRELAARHAPGDDDRAFHAEQNARVVLNAERYHRAAFRRANESRNVRTRHMAETLEQLVARLEQDAGPAKAVVWAHNTHVGDGRATEPGERGELNLGQLVRQRHGDGALLVGFTFYKGTVTAASSWGGAAERKRVRPALDGSWQALLHERGVPRFVVDTSTLENGRRLERAIGAVYLAQAERLTHYFHARLPDQFDFVVHLDDTQALEPIERTSEWVEGDVPTPYPFGV